MLLVVDFVSRLFCLLWLRFGGNGVLVRFAGGAAAVKSVLSGLPTLFVAAGGPRAAHQESGHQERVRDFLHPVASAFFAVFVARPRRILPAQTLQLLITWSLLFCKCLCGGATPLSWFLRVCFFWQ